LFNIHPKSNKKIKDKWRAKGKKRYINKVLADSGCGNMESFTQISTYSKYLPFNNMS